mmetsp:Transcript_4050/g.7783  ORF Transcript_4050/g.7783 Transcript_4050/m.7783 type:complete len:104 (-) Transcript_4050:415-726(-)
MRTTGHFVIKNGKGRKKATAPTTKKRKRKRNLRLLRIMTIKTKKQESSDGVVAIPPSKVNGDNGELRASGAWDSMDDHDKRKAYKRARQVIDVLRKRVEIEKT